MKDNRREELYDIINREMIGPNVIDWQGHKTPEGEEVLFGDGPNKRYIAGTLYPKSLPEQAADEQGDKIYEEPVADGRLQLDDKDSQFEFKETGEYLEEVEELINRSNAYKQSAMSITAALEAKSVNIEINAGHYSVVSTTDPKTGKVVSNYPREKIYWDNGKKAIDLTDVNNRVKSIDIPNTELRFSITYRYRKGNVVIYTFTLENTIVGSDSKSVRDKDCYFQVEFKLISNEGFSSLPDTQKICVNDEDYSSNQLLYRDVKNYAIGHGCAAEWEDDDEKVTWIKTAIFPMFEVKPIVPTTIDGVTLEMLKYGPDSDFKEGVKELYLLCDKYEQWISYIEKKSKNLESKYKRHDYLITAERHIRSCRLCLERMRGGIKLLEENQDVRTAFQYMNLVMLMQQLHYNLPLQKWECDTSNKLQLQDGISVLPNPYNKSTWYGNKDKYGKWRPFQLAFILMNLKSMLSKECIEREYVDLIWFPTGGGKTEAYLGLSAYAIFLRRLLNKDDSGTAILMRYTLRLLTAQQYERASAMICACDVVRLNHEDLFGKSRISIGLWVGSDTTPNRMSDALEKYDKLYKGKSDENPFVILKCPWCGAQMGVVESKGKVRRIAGYKTQIGPHRKKSVVFQCSNSICDFSKDNSPLPLYVVDESIYANTPTLLLGTVDKFAMLPFVPEAQRIFGYYDGVKLTSPDLIIQDELHLISGPLGSMVGHYETMISELCSQKIGEKKIPPKIIASTATISRAKEQCHALYGCSEDKVFQFPPSGIDAGDSFFAREDKNQNGRQYVGIMATGSSSDATTAIRLFASLLFAAKELNVSDGSKRDPYWTNIGYFNSLRELGQARTWIRADIDQYLDTMYKSRLYDKIYGADYGNRRRYINVDEELTSRIPGNKVTESLANLNTAYGGNNGNSIDICLATNMISVGLDVPRLGLMTVAGQPKTTSEYIQATSRVGRNSSDAPGIVFVLYRPGRPRDKSHYEQFRNYHSKLYCSVEPTSVTPFSSPVRARALHAIIIGLLRLQSTESYNKKKPSIPSASVVDYIEQVIRERVQKIDPEELEATIKLYESIISDWKGWNPDLWEAKHNKDWSFTDDIPLIYMAGSHPNDRWENRGFETPTSMRNVDSSCEADVLIHKYVAKEEE